MLLWQLSAALFRRRFRPTDFSIHSALRELRLLPVSLAVAGVRRITVNRGGKWASAWSRWCS
jgi:hypothetical protein